MKQDRQHQLPVQLELLLTLLGSKQPILLLESKAVLPVQLVKFETLQELQSPLSAELDFTLIQETRLASLVRLVIFVNTLQPQEFNMTIDTFVQQDISALKDWVLIQLQLEILTNVQRDISVKEESLLLFPV